MISILSRILDKFIRIYRKSVFLNRIKSKEKTVQVLGVVHVNATNVKIGKNVTIYPNVYFWGDGLIDIGDNVDIGIGTIIFAKNKVVIGDNTSIAANCYIIDSNHKIEKGIPINQQKLDVSEDGLIIGSDVWIAAGCTIIKGSKINNGAVIGAMSMVNSEINENGIAFGIPADVINYRK